MKKSATKITLQITMIGILALATVMSLFIIKNNNLKHFGCGARRVTIVEHTGNKNNKKIIEETGCKAS